MFYVYANDIIMITDLYDKSWIQVVQILQINLFFKIILVILSSLHLHIYLICTF